MPARRVEDDHKPKTETMPGCHVTNFTTPFVVIALALFLLLLCYCHAKEDRAMRSARFPTSKPLFDKIYHKELRWIP